MSETRSRTHGVHIVKHSARDFDTPQTSGMTRSAAVTRARVGARRLWAGTVAVQPGVNTGVHHHGSIETVLYVVRGRARMRWGEQLEFEAEAGPGDFIYVPPFVPHQETNASSDEPLECVIVRSDPEPITVNLDGADTARRGAGG